MLTIVGILVFLTAIPLCIIFNPYSANNSNKLAQVIIVFVFALILVIPIVAGLLSVNKFRKGYDIDVSDTTEKDDVRNSGNE